LTKVKNIIYDGEVIWEKIADHRLKIIEEQQKEIEALKRLVKERSEKIARLEKNLTNSSKPPSSDITEPPKKEGEKGEKPKTAFNYPPLRQYGKFMKLVAFYHFYSRLDKQFDGVGKFFPAVTAVTQDVRNF
jgi:hypothetical protein